MFLRHRMGLIECDVSSSYNAKRYSYIKKCRHRYKTTLGPIKRVFFYQINQLLQPFK